MNKNIRKPIVRLDAVIMLLIVLFVSSTCYYGNASFGVVSVSDVLEKAVSFDNSAEEQQHFVVSNTQEDLILVEIQEKNVEEKNDDKAANCHYWSDEALTYAKRTSQVQFDIFLSISKLKRYILFHALKLDC